MRMCFLYKLKEMSSKVLCQFLNRVVRFLLLSEIFFLHNWLYLLVCSLIVLFKSPWYIWIQVIHQGYIADFFLPDLNFSFCTLNIGFYRRAIYCSLKHVSLMRWPTDYLDMEKQSKQGLEARWGRSGGQKFTWAVQWVEKWPPKDIQVLVPGTCKCYLIKKKGLFRRD